MPVRVPISGVASRATRMSQVRYRLADHQVGRAAEGPC